MRSFVSKPGYRKSSREQVAEVIRNQIISREYKPGEKLPTTKEFVEIAGVSSHTVRQALMALENEGLVASTQGKGTFVTEGHHQAPLADGGNNHGNGNGSQLENQPEIQSDLHPDQQMRNRTKTIAIMGVFSADTDLPERYQRETAAGIMAESQRLGLAAHIMPPQLREQPTKDIVSALKAIHADGVIWPAPFEKEWDRIEALRDSGFHIVATQRADGDSWLPSVAGDYQTAGAQVGRHFVKKRCNEVVVFSYSSSIGKLPVTMAEGVPNGMLVGLLNAFARGVHTAGDLVCMHCNKGYSLEISNDIFNKLAALPLDSGVIFANTYQFGNLLKDKGEATVALLKNRHVVVLSNPSVINRLIPLVGNLEIHFLVDPYEKIASFAVQKLHSQMNGNLADVKSLLKVDLTCVADWHQDSNFGR